MWVYAYYWYQPPGGTRGSTGIIVQLQSSGISFPLENGFHGRWILWHCIPLPPPGSGSLLPQSDQKRSGTHTELSKEKITGWWYEVTPETVEGSLITLTCFFPQYGRLSDAWLVSSLWFAWSMGHGPGVDTCQSCLSCRISFVLVNISHFCNPTLILSLMENFILPHVTHSDILF